MDIDPNDLLSTNVFINEPLLDGEVPDEFNEEFKKYYKSEQEKNQKKVIEKKLDIRNDMFINEETDGNNLLNTNKFGKGNDNKVAVNRVKKDIKTLISVDSRDRDKTKYPLASNFEIFLGKTYYNVREVRLASIEFPNTNAVINSTNNLIYWRNKEDIDLDIIDNITQTYTVYKAPLRIGSYVSSSLQTEMTREMNLIKRSNLNAPNYHYFVITLDFDTDIVTFISLILTPLFVNPITTIVNTGIITVAAQKHGYSNGENVYILGASTTAGISSSTLNGFQKITVIDSNTFQYEVNVNASETVSGGGNVVETGKSAPFQFAFGEYSNTVAPNIGYPIENSSQLINTSISSIQNYYQFQITAVGTSFIADFNHISQNIILQNSGGYLNNNGVQGNSIDGVHSISNVINSTTFLISASAKLYETIYMNQQENDLGTGEIVSGMNYISSYAVSSNVNLQELVLPPFLSQNDNYYIGWWICVKGGDAINNVRQIINYKSVTNTITLNTPLTASLNTNDIYYLYSAPTFIFNSTVYTITSIENYNIETVLFTFFTSHNYSFSDIGVTLTFYNTTSKPSFDGDNILLGIPSPTSLYVSGYVLPGGSVNTNIPGAIGTMPLHNALTTKALNISSVIPGNVTTIVTKTEHGLSIGDTITLNNVLTTPPLTSITYTVYTIPDLYTFTIDYKTYAVDVNSLALAYVGTDLITVHFPNHGFNSIINVTAGPTTNTAIIQTLLPHNLVTGNLTRIMQTGIQYIDNNAFTITYLTSDTFEINVVVPYGFVISSNTGILGMSNTFRLYNCTESIAGISTKFLNNILFTVNEIIDANTFNFHLYNVFANASVSGCLGVYISSFIHGFNVTQTNTKNSILNRSINLEGENYAFLCSSKLSTVMNTGSVKNIFARIILDQSPGTVVFNFLSNPKKFETVPLAYLDTLDLSVLNYDGTNYIFNDLDYSFTLEITEVVDTTDNFNISSKRGISDIDSNHNVIGSSSNNTIGIGS